MIVFSSEPANPAPFANRGLKDSSPKKQQSSRRRHRVLHALLRAFVATSPPAGSPHGYPQAVKLAQQRQEQSQHAEDSMTVPLPQAPQMPLEPAPEQQGLSLPGHEPDCRPDAPRPDVLSGDVEEDTAASSIANPPPTLTTSPAPAPSVEAQQRVAVKRLLFGVGTEEDRAAAATEVGKIASLGGHRTRKSLASLGVIPCLVDMLDGKGTAPSAAARALVQLADGSYSDKVALVEAGVVPKLTRALEVRDYCDHDDNLMALLQTITSLAKASLLAHHLPQSSCTKLLPAILRAISTTDATTSTTRRAALSALLNLSSHLPNARPIVATGFVPPLLRICADVEAGQCSDSSSRLAALGTLGNLVMTPEGRMAVEREDALAPACFVRILKSADGEFQDRAARVLAELMRGSGVQRRRMLEIGVVKVLVEVSLLSESAAARRRAAEMINWLKGPEYCAWAPVTLQDRCRSNCSSSSSSSDELHAGDEGDGRVVTMSGKQRAGSIAAAAGGQHHRNEIRRMVRQSLDRNMESIVRRAGNGSISSAATTTTRSSSCLAQISRHHLSSSPKQDIKDSVGSTASFKSLSF